MAKTIIEIEVRADGGQVTSTIRNVAGDVTKLATTTDTATNRMSGSFNQMRTSIFNAQNALRGFIGLLAVRELARFGSSFIEAGSQVEQYRVRLTALTGSQAEANRQLERFTEIAATTPFELPAVVEAATTLEAFGANAQKTLKPVADLAAFMGVDIPQAAASFGRAFAGGAGAADVLRDRGVLTLVKLREGLDDLSKLSLPEFRRALLEAMVDPAGRIQGTTTLLANTWVGAVSNMKDAWFQFQASVAESGFLELLTKQIRTATDLMQDFGTAIGAGFDLGTASASKLQKELEFNQRRLEQIESSGILGRLLSPLVGTAEEAELRILDAQLALDEFGDSADTSSKKTNTLTNNTNKLTESLKGLKKESSVVGQLLAGGGETGARITLEQGRIEQSFIDKRLAAELDLAKAIQGQNTTIAQQQPLLKENADLAGSLITGVQGIVESAISGTLDAASLGKRVLSELASLASQQISGLVQQLFKVTQLSPLTATAGGVVASASQNVSVPGLGLLGKIPGALGGILGGAGLGFGLGGLIGGTSGQIGGGVGGLLGGIASAIPVGTGVLSGGTIGSFAGGAVSSAIGGTLGSTIGGLVANFGIPVIGSLLGILFSQVFKSIPDPTVNVGAGVGVSVDAATGRITVGRASLTKFQFDDISKSEAEGVANDVVAALNETGSRFARILGVFPRFIVDTLVPQIDATNAALGSIFTRLKFNDLGLPIADELKNFARLKSPIGFFLGTRELLGGAIAGSLESAGLTGLTGAVGAAFPAVPSDIDLSKAPNSFKALQRKLGGLQVPRRKKDVPGFLEALETFAGLSAGVARGAPFLTDLDTSALTSAFGTTLGIRNGAQFPAAVEQLNAQAGPVVQFIEQASEQAENLFARGLTAAMEAANESNAKNAFLSSFGNGIRETVLGGLQEAFIASAQFKELLAPVQQTIRDFVQQSLATGEAPDLGAFRTAILPTIEDASARAVALAPLAAELNRFTKVITDAIGAGGLSTDAAAVNNDVTINIQGGNAQEIADAIADLLQGKLAPPDLGSQ